MILLILLLLLLLQLVCCILKIERKEVQTSSEIKLGGPTGTNFGMIANSENIFGYLEACLSIY